MLPAQIDSATVVGIADGPAFWGERFYTVVCGESFGVELPSPRLTFIQLEIPDVTTLAVDIRNNYLRTRHSIDKHVEGIAVGLLPAPSSPSRSNDQSAGSVRRYGNRNRY